MKRVFQIVALSAVTLWASAGLAQTSNEALVNRLLGALQSGNQAALQAMFISEAELVRSVMEDTYPNEPKRQKETRLSMEKEGKKDC